MSKYPTTSCNVRIPIHWEKKVCELWKRAAEKIPALEDEGIRVYRKPDIWRLAIRLGITEAEKLLTEKGI